MGWYLKIFVGCAIQKKFQRRHNSQDGRLEGRCGRGGTFGVQKSKLSGKRSIWERAFHEYTFRTAMGNWVRMGNFPSAQKVEGQLRLLSSSDRIQRGGGGLEESMYICMEKGLKGNNRQ